MLGATCCPTSSVCDTSFLFPPVFRLPSLHPQPLMLHSAGAFNDPDYLLFQDASGRYAQTAMQTRLQFSVYAMLAAPLIVSQDLTRTREEPFVLQTLLNREVIGVDQDALGNGGGGEGGVGGDCVFFAV